MGKDEEEKAREVKTLEDTFDHFKGLPLEELVTCINKNYTSINDLIDKHINSSSETVTRMYAGEPLLRAVLELQRLQLVLIGAYLSHADNEAGLRYLDLASDFKGYFGGIVEF